MADPARVKLLRDTIRACRSCDLRDECSSPVVPRGPLTAELMVVGEAPGRTEDKQGRPFVGPAAWLLEGVMREVGIEPRDLLYANSANCWPSKSHTPHPSHIAACSRNLDAVLSVYSPSIVLIVGRTAMSAFWPDLTGELSNDRIRGRPLFLHRERLVGDGGGPLTLTAWFTYHPASALPRRKPALRDTIRADLHNLVSYHRDGNDTWPIDCVRCGSEDVDKFDERGLAFCTSHSAQQGKLF